MPKRPLSSKKLTEAARRVKLIAFDVDGVLTDGRITYTSDGAEIKSFHVRDGHAMKMALRAGLDMAIITGRSSPMVETRASELGISRVYQFAKDKVKALEALVSDSGVSPSEMAYLGDDVVDLPVILRVGLGCAVADAPPEVTSRAALVTEAEGGCGAARELIVFILMAQGKWEGIMEKYAGEGKES